MRKRTLVLIAVPLTVLVGAAAFGFGAGGERKAPPEKPKSSGQRRALQEACASDRTYDGLKTQIFDEATAIRGANGARLDLLSGATVVRMTDPVLKSKSDDLGVTVCAGRFTVELPPGSESGFDGLRRLEADIEYAAQPAADGSGLVYQLRGAEPIVYRLAAFRMSPSLTAVAPPGEPLIDSLSEPVKVEAKPGPGAPPEPEPAPAKKAEANKPEPAKKAEIKKAVAKKDVAKAAPPKKVAKKSAAAKPAPKKPEKKAAAKKVEPVKKAAARKPAVKKPEPKKAAGKKPAVKKPEVKKAAAKKPPAKKTTPPAKQAKAMPKPAPVKKAAATVRKAAAPKPVAANPCAAKRSLAERLICGSPAIATKDRRVTSLYISALDNADPETHAILRRTAGNFAAYRSGCRTEACLSTAYDDRMAEIRDIMADMR